MTTQLQAAKEELDAMKLTINEIESLIDFLKIRRQEEYLIEALRFTKFKIIEELKNFCLEKGLVTDGYYLWHMNWQYIFDQLNKNGETK